MPAALCPLSANTQFDAAGRPLLGGELYVFATGTTTLASIFADPAGTVPMSNPVPLTGSGRVPPVYFGVGMVDLRIVDAKGGLIDQVAGIAGGTAASSSGATTSDVTFQTGDLKPSLGAGTQTGWVRCNGRTIGNGVSGGTEIASDTASALFAFLWNNIPALKATVSGNAGPNALADFTAGKTIALPSLRGRTFMGVDGMGSSLANVLSTLTSTSPDTIGTVLGSESHTMAGAEIAAHTHGVTINEAGDHAHTITVAAGGGHTHTATAASAGAHQHGGSTDSQGGHQHGGTSDPVGDHFHNLGTVTVNMVNGGNSLAIQGGSAYAQQTQAAGGHAHTFTTGAAGVHQHGVTTDSQGLHVHAIAVAGVPDHTHAASSDIQGGHVHTASTTIAGSGVPFATVPPAMLGTWLIKL